MKAPLEIHQFINKYAPELSYNDKLMMEADLMAIIEKDLYFLKKQVQDLNEILNPTFGR